MSTRRKKDRTSGFFLSRRQTELTEWMDLRDCDPVMLRNTYRYFSIVNRLISRWDAVYRRWIRPELHPHRTFRLLDVGSGGGDLTYRIRQLAVRDGFRLSVTGIDPDPRAWDFAVNTYNGNNNDSSGSGRNAGKTGKSPRSSQPGIPAGTDGLQFRRESARSLIDRQESFDFVICNHVLHHLGDKTIPEFMNELTQLARIRVLCSDIERSVTGYAMFSVATWPLFPKSFIRADGLISIRKSFTLHELRRLAPAGWTVNRMFPYRLLAVFDCKKTDTPSDN
ncbi:methyltransferase domain-containing protein [Natronogracilivirga saccharolytica]|uniref:Methyltransferase n=1 Tax=Natronogracilivirga saccharolytica TaxID=2812953 RepID=A0A8J7RKW1_9BACT|nr:methyltransferase domain-containing protein [Natronogracilivirga saccharolytica]MBP3192018.1 methyltransferase [Natronogracilivirga saccharolytica]